MSEGRRSRKSASFRYSARRFAIHARACFMLPRHSRRQAACLLTIVLATAALAGCGRKGMLELPPEVAARAPDASQPAAPAPASLGANAPVEQKALSPVPGTKGMRPPELYPFVLDPIL